ncbi:MAG: hypothetical protein MK188_02250 [Gammaproteobacteria bacterium]|nr:hypothetical protein [Gammaproteobacteria bacterium]
MIFALLFFFAFVIGVVTYVISDRWWAGALISAAIPVLAVLAGIISPALQSMALYFGLPIAFFGSLFGAYVVNLRRAPELDDGHGQSESVDSKSN